MRIRELQLLKYGPFDDQVLRFPGRAPGLHIIFGRNEAGKSSALRALKALLFGIARNTADDFIHGSDLLSVGAVLETVNGSSLELQRWKKSPHLRDKNNKALADSSLLTQCLNGMDVTSFERFYGLDYEELQSGSKMLLQEKGNVGTSIFSAGLGALDVRKVLDELEEKAAELFKSKAKNPTINAAITAYNQRKTEIKAASLNVKVFLEKEEQLREANGKLECLKLLQKDLSGRKNRLERIRRTRPMIAELNEFEMQLKDLGEVVLLPPGFIPERRALSEKARKLQDEIADRTREIERVREDMSKLLVPADVLRLDAAISALQKDLRSYTDARADLPGLKATAGKARDEAAFILKNLRPGIPLADAESLRLRADHTARIRTLAAEEKTLRKTHESCALEVRELEDELKEAKDKLALSPPPVSTERINEIIATVQREGDLNAKLTDEKKKLKRLRDETDAALKRLPFWSGSLAELSVLKIPGAETIAEFDARIQRKDAERSRLATQVEGLDKTIKECATELEHLQQTGADIPTAAQLAAARAHRASGWELVRRAWLKKENVARETLAFHPTLELPDAFEKSVQDADAVADNRFRDATRVGQHEDRLKRIDAAHGERAALLALCQKCETELDAVQSEWRARWESLGVTPGSLAEMRGWIVQRNDLAQRAEKMREHERECETLIALIEQRTRALSDALAACAVDDAPKNPTLDALLELARRFCKKQESCAQTRKALETAVDATLKNWRKKVAARDHAETALKEWKEQWAGAMALLQLRPDALVQEASETLAKLQDLFGTLDPLPDAEKRIAGIEKAISRFEAEATKLVAELDPSLSNLHPDQATEALNDRLIQARAAHVKREQWFKQCDESARKNERAHAEWVAIQTRLEELCSIAECGEPLELDVVERRFEQHGVLLEKIEKAKKAIFNSGDGWSLIALIAEPEDVNSDELEAEHAQTVKGLADLDAEFHDAHSARARLKSELDAMDGKAGAAEAAAHAQLILAQIRDEAEQYVRLRAAGEILKREIERYRDENQTPLLKHASAIFAKLTCGGFSGVRADLDERGQNVLMGVRKNGHPLGVEGMSDGTRDQLYLALRLAFLPLYLEKEENEPLPFVIDDVLINFDDTRCAAAFQYLYEISDRVQVIVFTHHKHIVDLATDVLPGAVRETESSATLEVHSFVNA